MGSDIIAVARRCVTVKAELDRLSGRQDALRLLGEVVTWAMMAGKQPGCSTMSSVKFARRAPTRRSNRLPLNMLARSPAPRLCDELARG
jgi:hypothetical protein